MKKITVLLFTLVALFSTGAHAEEGLSIGASLGYTNIENSEPGFDFSANDTGYKIFGKYSFGNGLGLEGGYIDFGEPNDTVLGQAGAIDATGWNLYGVGSLPLSNKVNLFAKAGVIAWDSESLITGLRVGANDGTDLALGFGALWNADSSIGIRAEFDWFDIPDPDDVWMASIGLVVRF